MRAGVRPSLLLAAVLGASVVGTAVAQATAPPAEAPPSAEAQPSPLPSPAPMQTPMPQPASVVAPPAANTSSSPSGSPAASESPRPLRLPPTLGVVNQQPAPPPAVTGAAAQDVPGPLSLTVADAIRRALDAGTQAALARSGELRARIARQEALEAMFPQASASLQQYNQSINLETFGFTVPGQPPVVGPFDVTDAQVTAAMQVINIAAWRAYQSRTTGLRASRFEVARAENDIATAVARLYLLVARADAQVASRDADLGLFRELRRVAGDQLEAGSGTRLDVAQADVQVARAQQSLLVARNDRETARLALLTAIGAPAGTAVVLRDSLATPPAPGDLAAALAAAHARRPELQALDLEVEAARLLVEAQRDRRLPSVSVDFTGDYNGNHASDLMWTRRIAAVAGVPLFRGDINAAIARAEVDLDDARTRRTQAERDVEQEVRATLLTLESSRARVDVAAQTSRVAEDALGIARDRRAAGYGSGVEVDRAEDTYRQAHEDLIAAQADAAMAWYQLERATGDIRGLFASGEAPP
jgi:outer membrane protein TolC